jgi:hypothetical protein
MTRRSGLGSLGLLGAVGVTLLVVLSFLGLPGARSSQDDGEEGLRLLVDVLRGLGHAPRSFQLPSLALRHEPPGSVLIVPAVGNPLVAPVLDRDDAAAMRDFARRGSTVLLASGYEDALTALLDAGFQDRGLPPLPPGGQFDVSPVAPHPLAPVGPLTFSNRAVLAPDHPRAFPLYAKAGHAVVQEFTVGQGSIVVLTDPFVLSNRGIEEGQNLEFVTELVRVRLRPGGKVLIDDLHGGGADGRGLLAYARRRGLGPALVVLALGVGLAFIRFAARTGPVLPLAEELAAPAAVEHVRALGRLYARGGHGAHAVAVVSRRLRRILTARSGVAWEPAAMAAHLRREFGPAAATEFEDLRLAFGAALQHERVAPKVAQALALRVHAFLTRWRLHGPAPAPKERIPAP